MSALDRRVTPIRDDLAAAELRGTVEAPRFAEGKRQRIVRGRMALRASPSADARQETELLFGEVFTIYESVHGWAWGQAYLDGGVIAIDAPVGQGRLLMFGADILQRAQPYGTFKFLFNGIYLK